MKTCINCHVLYYGFESICKKCEDKLKKKINEREKAKQYAKINKDKLKVSAKLRNEVSRYKKEVNKSIEDRLYILKKEREYLLKIRAIK